MDDGFLNIELSLDGNDKSWFVTLVHEECGSGWGTYLEAEWSDFAEDNDVNVGDALIFTYLGDSSFDVEIRRPRGGKRDEENEYGGSSGTSSKKRGRKPAIVERLSSKMIETNACLAKLAAACYEHHFLFTFTKAYVDQGIINVPFDFAKRHFIDFPETTNVILQLVDTRFNVQLKVLKK
ncbi:B3 domain-containing protein REM9-like [Chenopodium quinoa]|uniref:B3 domain-containing protein REM9-like n=1 Tax=Chenopodium quinoa TaxID=63459 RepID=UPI000B779E56|nr:B3 domain-containing protein REM9-like [Chenopodium quinoa]